MGSKARLTSLSVLLFAAAGSLLGEPAAGDWLVTREGARLETRGAWEVKGNLVVFHLPNGVFSSMRRDSIDLDKSTALTERMKQAAEAEKTVPSTEAAPRPKATFILTDADVEHVEEVPILPAGGDSGEAPRESGGRREVQLEENPLEVSSWRAVLGADANGVSISGLVKNPSEYFASGIAIEVTALSLEGEELGSRSASVDPEALAPGERGSFLVSFPGVFAVGNALFEVTSFNAVVNESSDGG